MGFSYWVGRRILVAMLTFWEDECEHPDGCDSLDHGARHVELDRRAGPFRLEGHEEGKERFMTGDYPCSGRKPERRWDHAA